MKESDYSYGSFLFVLLFLAFMKPQATLVINSSLAIMAFLFYVIIVKAFSGNRRGLIIRLIAAFTLALASVYILFLRNETNLFS